MVTSSDIRTAHDRIRPYLRTTPVAEIDGKQIGDGTRPVMMRIRELYKALVADEIARHRSG